MKRRWGVLFYVALTPLIGISWLFAGFEGSLLTAMNIHLIGQIAAAGIAFYAMVRSIEKKWPAIVALICAAPMGLQMLRVIDFIDDLASMFGAPAILLVFGSLLTVVTALTLAVLPPPKPPVPPPVAPARVVE